MQNQTGQDVAGVVGTCARCVAQAPWRASLIASLGGSCWRDVMLSRSCTAGSEYRVGTCPGRDHDVDKASAPSLCGGAVHSRGRGCSAPQPSRPPQVLYRMRVVLHILPRPFQSS